MQVETVRTADYRQPNGVSALAAGALTGGEPVLLAMCDHLVDPALYGRIKAAGSGQGLRLGIDRRLGHPWTDPEDVTCVRTDGSKIVAIGKGLEPHDAYDTGVFAVGAPFFVPDTPPTKGNPIYLNSADGFATPKAFVPGVVVDIDAVAEKKFACVAAMPSQFADADSWQGRTLPNMPTDEAGRKAYIMETVRQWLASAADEYRPQLIARYGQERGSKVKYAEAFQLNQYGRQVKPADLDALLPR